MNWQAKSKRFFIILVVNAVWIACLITKDALFLALTPYVIGLDGGYILGESWRPSGPGNNNTGQ